MHDILIPLLILGCYWAFLFGSGLGLCFQKSLPCDAGSAASPMIREAPARRQLRRLRLCRLRCLRQSGSGVRSGAEPLLGRRSGGGGCDRTVSRRRGGGNGASDCAGCLQGRLCRSAGQGGILRNRGLPGGGDDCRRRNQGLPLRLSRTGHL